MAVDWTGWSLPDTFFCLTDSNESVDFCRNWQYRDTGDWGATMSFFTPIHLLILLAVIVLFFGGKRIPELGRGMGEGIRNFREGVRGKSDGPDPDGTQNGSDRRS
jgi:sec-independent protein translocase protein TatA